MNIQPLCSWVKLTVVGGIQDAGDQHARDFQIVPKSQDCTLLCLNDQTGLNITKKLQTATPVLHNSSIGFYKINGDVATQLRKYQITTQTGKYIYDKI